MKPVLLVIMDGIGLRDEAKGNAFQLANTPNLDMLMNQYPNSKLIASGEEVGLPMGQIGNSEVGHLNIGSGRIVYQPLQKINKDIEDKSFYQNPNILELMKYVKEKKSRLQVFGLLSDGGVHSHINHLLAILELLKKENIEEVYLHLFTDGRDTLTDSAKEYFDILDNKLKELNIGKIATISGRFYAMDRDNRWDRIEKAYQAIVDGIGEHANSYQEVLENSYRNGITDEFIVPTILDQDGLIKDNDGLLVFNYRPDRLRELFSAMTNPNFDAFVNTKIHNLKLVTMMDVSNEVIYTPAYPHEVLNNTLGDWISLKGLKQLRIAETEKYAHVTYFFDGGVDKEIEGCDRILIPSPKVATYDLIPEMSAVSITDTVLEKIDADQYDLIILNYANGDMVGHTGNLEKAIIAVETVDQEVGRLYQKIKEKNGLLILTADHGNCELMIDENNNIITSHTTSKVPFIICNQNYQLKDGKLADIAPTILKIMGIEIPSDMTGEILIQ